MAVSLEQLVRDYLAQVKAMHLATVSNGKPWVCNVWFTFDDDLNLYWFSSITRRHSKELALDPHVAGSMFLPQTPTDKPRGLQFEGIGELLTDDADIDLAKQLHIARGTFTAEQIPQAMANPAKPHRFYRIRPELFVLFDVQNFPDDPRQEYRLIDD